MGVLRSPFLVCLVACLVPGVPATGQVTDVDFVFEGYPVREVISPDFDGLDLEDGQGFEEVELLGYWSSMPTIRLGVGLDTPVAYLDGTVGGGLLWHGLATEGDGGFIAPFIQPQVALRFKIGNIVTLGPQLGCAYFFEPIWYGDGDVDFSDSLGFTGGIGVTVGSKRVSFSAAIEYIGAEFDVRGEDGFVTDRDEIDLSGVSIQLGVLLRF